MAVSGVTVRPMRTPNNRRTVAGRLETVSGRQYRFLSEIGSGTFERGNSVREKINVNIFQGFASNMVKEPKSNSGNGSRPIKGKFLIVAEFFIATRIHRNREIVAEDSLIRETLNQKSLSLTLKRLYLFALILNMPGQRKASIHRDPAGAQNAFVREVLYKGKGWVERFLDIDKYMGPCIYGWLYKAIL